MLRVLARRAGCWGSLNPWMIAQPRRDFCLGLGVLPDSIDRTSDSFTRNSNAMDELISDLQSHITKVLSGGGAEAVKRNKSRNKLLPRERIDRLLDPASSFLELSQVSSFIPTLFTIIFLFLWLLPFSLNVHCYYKKLLKIFWNFRLFNELGFCLEVQNFQISEVEGCYC